MPDPIQIGLTFFAVVIPAAIILRILVGHFDQKRIRKYVRRRRGRVLHCRWAPFGPGWLGEKSDRIYVVRYIDLDGNTHVSHCKTSMWTGVYFTRDNIAKHSARVDVNTEPLAEENRRLREELERLKSKLSRSESAIF